ncbi:hypothetical protein ACVIWU_000998 [Bradyrhizobium sp. USDA 4509]
MAKSAGNLNVGHEQAVHHSDEDGQRRPIQQWQQDGLITSDEYERRCAGDGHRCHQRQIDSPTDDDDCHPDSQDSQDGDVSDERQQIVGRGEAADEDAEYAKCYERQREYDALLIEEALWAAHDEVSNPMRRKLPQIVTDLSVGSKLEPCDPSAAGRVHATSKRLQTLSYGRLKT